jgi:chemotaxis protein CheD
MNSTKNSEEMGKKFFHVNIGKVFACREKAVIQTLLGSCVSACFFDPVARVSGMNHILLPGKADLNKFDDTARYGINGMELLINEMTKLGALRSRLRAKVFGGGHVLTTIPLDRSPGAKNVEFVLDYLTIEQIPLVCKDVGGSLTRIIHFHTDTFEIFVKKLQISSKARLFAEEEKLAEEARKKIADKGDMTFF